MTKEYTWADLKVQNPLESTLSLDKIMILITKFRDDITSHFYNIQVMRKQVDSYGRHQEIFGECLLTKEEVMKKINELARKGDRE
ncbi:hypothetical protein UFOVP733_34 [uncultured Caudovirales phage]|uniref:Uncharacterized protein n=1 Tax=uncultured Caudovirales phage TaxID=2100421 RepID=A0A6J7X2G5_9CAUD|nr:hypothetical protein UFOVP733_34 [uncultured Caudovirales phage]CAB5224886.1 hypothetical protein UFOVP743_25 [uncultured Caudovirales phage]